MKLFTTKNLKCLIVSLDIWVCFTIVLEKSEVLLNSYAVLLIASFVKKRQTEKNTSFYWKQNEDGYTVCGTCYDKLGDNPICTDCFCALCYSSLSEKCSCFKS